MTDNKCFLCGQEYPPKTATEAMLRTQEEIDKEQRKMVWENMDQEKRTRLTREVETSIAKAKEALMETIKHTGIPNIFLSDEQKNKQSKR